MDCSIDGESCGFSCTGFEGSDIWEARRKVTEAIGCESCRDHALADESAYHDVVNVGLGKRPYDLKNLLRYRDQIDCVVDRCVADGRCKL